MIDLQVASAPTAVTPSPHRAASDDSRIDDLIAAHRPGYCLAQPFYNDPAVFARDMERIFTRHWVYAGHVSRIPTAGDYFLLAIGGESIIVIRGQGGAAHALFNVCRHRGSRVCLEEQGHAKSGALVCPYHAWAYATDGSLLAARAMGPEFDKGEYGLRRCGVRVIEGLIFVKMSGEADDPPGTAEAFADLERLFKPHGFATANTAARMVWIVEANWKLVVENFGECYHCAPTHPEYCHVMAHATGDSGGYPRHAEEFKSLWERWETSAKERGLPTGRSAHSPSGLCNWVRMPIREGFLTQSPDGKPVAPLMGDFTEYDGGYTGIRIYPVNYCIACSDHGIVPRFTPLGPTRTEVEFTWLVHPDAVEGKDYDVDRLTWVWRVTTDQDKKIVDDNQAGVNSMAYVPGPYSQAEQGLVSFTTWYLRQLS